MQPAPELLLLGASRGLGAALALEVAKRGWKVVGTVRGDGRTPLHDAADLHGGRIEVESVDVTRPEQIAALAERLSGRTFTALVVNAGAGSADPLATMLDTAPEEFMRVMLTNAYGVVRCVEALQYLVQPDGLIAIMSSGQGSLANNLDGRNDLYRSSKAALNQLMRSFAARQASGCRALVLMAPGWIRTELGGAAAPYSVEESAPKITDVLLGTIGTPGLRYLDRDGRVVPW